MAEERGKMFTVVAVVVGLVISVALGWYFLSSFSPKVNMPDSPTPVAEP